ncbi:type II toxin-antitoxin system VapC family toxin [Acidobacteria bacterium AH-259-G07]|nr:type II toxin-antitoxin system VapC family toxin [Acidobacteria bacterium AH-259-G07]
MKFWDSSAMVPLLVDEPRSASIKALVRKDNEVVLWWGSIVECASALARSAREGKIDLSAEQSARKAVDELQARAFEIQPVEDLRLRALRLLRIHPLRAADAFQLSAALIWCGEHTDGAGFVCLDSRLRQAALREGFDVLPSDFS